MSKAIHILVGECSRDVQDTDKVFWENADWLMFANDGRTQLWELKPRIFETTEDMTLSLGVDQAVPNASKLFYEASSNKSHISKRAITVVSEELLSRSRPNWRSEAPSARIVHYMYDEQRPGNFKVYPPAVAGSVIEVRYAKPPVELVTANIDGTIPYLLIDEGTQYVALGYYMKARAYLKGANTSNGYGAKASSWIQLFQETVIGESNAKTRNSPNANKIGGGGPANKQP